jgi:monovalent cation:H+ antiporter-2, CPA2 family
MGREECATQQLYNQAAPPDVVLPSRNSRCGAIVMHEMHLLQDLLVLFGIGIFTVVIFHRFSLPPVLGFLLTGIICGPFGFKFVESTHAVDFLAELGVVLLLFTIGIEFSFAKLKRLKRFLIFGGLLQVLLTTGAATVAAMVFGMAWNVAVLIGMLVSLSSTALIIRLLDHRGELSRTHGLASISILIFQDLCIVPMVIAVPLLAGAATDVTSILWLVGKAVIFVALSVGLARYLVPWLLDHVAYTRKREVFILSTMLLCLGTGWATSQVGLSMALGAFLAGLVISESDYSHQAMSDVLPFREVFTFLVFVSIGMLFDVRTLIHEPLLILGLVVSLVLVKALIMTGITMGLGHSLRVALLTGFTLAQISEFSFVLAKIGLQEKLLDSHTNQVFLAVAILSMAVTPGLPALARLISDWTLKYLPESWQGRDSATLTDEEKLKDHVIIVGYGLTGQVLEQALRAQKIPHTVIEHDPEVVAKNRKLEVPIFYGDAVSESVLEHANLQHARMLAITTADAHIAELVAKTARRFNAQMQIIARTRDVESVKRLRDAGIDIVVAEELGGATEVTKSVLRGVELADDRIDCCVSASFKQVIDRLPKHR